MLSAPGGCQQAARARDRAWHKAPGERRGARACESAGSQCPTTVLAGQALLEGAAAYPRGKGYTRARTDRRAWAPGRGVCGGLLAGSEAAPSCRRGNRGSAPEPAQDHRARKVPASGRTRQTLSPGPLCPGSHTSARALHRPPTDSWATSTLRGGRQVACWQMPRLTQSCPRG